LTAIWVTDYVHRDFGYKLEGIMTFHNAILAARAPFWALGFARECSMTMMKLRMLKRVFFTAMAPP